VRTDRAVRLLLAVGLAVAVSSVVSAAEKIPGQRPLLVIGDQFQWVHGSWATYDLYDKAKRERSKMYIAILEQGKKKNRQGIWLEVGIEMRGEPKVMTRMLAEMTPSGPGDLLEAIVQVEGMGAFSVPGSFMKQGNEEGERQVGQVRPAREVRRMEERVITRRGRELKVWDVEAEDADGKPVKAVVSIELPPIAVVSADTDEMQMEIVDWGLAARSRITSKPMNFYLWIASQIGKGMSEGEKR
jgi:hypothetical protein